MPQKNLEDLRQEIDAIDVLLLDKLAERMEVAKQIAAYKTANKLPVLQTGRRETLLQEKKEKGAQRGLSEESISTIRNAIHKESVRVQEGAL